MSYTPGTFIDMTAQRAPISVTIMDQSGAGKVAGTITLDGIDSCITVRDLIRTRVREEVARYNAKAASTDIFHGLVMPDGAQPTPQGLRLLHVQSFSPPYSATERGDNIRPMLTTGQLTRPHGSCLVLRRWPRS
jgi:hypothetical protein